MAPPSKRNYMEIMEIDDGSGSAMMEEKKEKEPKRISRSELERREYWLRWRAADASNKLVAVRHRQDNLKWKNMSKRRLIKEELFFSKDIDFTRIKLSDAPAPARRDLVSGKAPAPAGGATSPGIKLSYTPSQWDKQMLQPAPAGGVTSPVPSFPNKD